MALGNKVKTHQKYQAGKQEQNLAYYLLSQGIYSDFFSEIQWVFFQPIKSRVDGIDFSSFPLCSKSGWKLYPDAGSIS